LNSRPAKDQFESLKMIVLMASWSAVAAATAFCPDFMAAALLAQSKRFAQLQHPDRG
jgi:hypothetical protein